MASTTHAAIVTGAAMGLGRAIALRLAADGCHLVVNDLPAQQESLDTLVKEIESGGGKAVSFAGDAAVEDSVKALVGKCVEVFGGLDVMVCNAGVTMVKPILECSIEDVQRLFDINFRAAWFGYRTAAEQMIKQGRGGRIIGAASIVAKKGYPFMSVYSATKFAIRGLTQSAAQEFGQFGITVNAYCPGCVWTPMIENQGAAVSKYLGAAAPGGDPKAIWAKACALQRVGEPADVAGLVSYFASKDSAFITGQSLTIDGGSIFD